MPGRTPLLPRPAPERPLRENSLKVSLEPPSKGKTGMKRCEEFEVGIEMRLHGALDVQHAGSLVTHLLTCASCRAFEDLAKGSETAMNHQSHIHQQTLDWDALSTRTQEFIGTQSRQRVITAAVVAIAATPAVMLSVNNVLWSAIGMVLLWSTVIVVHRLLQRRKLDAIAKYQGDTGELLYFYRRELEDRLRATRQGALLFPLWVGLLAIHLAHPYESQREWVGFALLGVVVAGSSAYIWFVRRPPIARELAALKGELKAERSSR